MDTQYDLPHFMEPRQKWDQFGELGEKVGE